MKIQNPTIRKFPITCSHFPDLLCTDSEVWTDSCLFQCYPFFIQLVQALSPLSNWTTRTLELLITWSHWTKSVSCHLNCCKQRGDQVKSWCNMTTSSCDAKLLMTWFQLACNWSEGKNKTKFLGCNSVHQWLAFDSVCIHSENRKFVHQYNQLLILLINKNHQQLIQSIHVMTFLKTNIVPENWCLEEDPASLKTGHLGKKPNSWMTELFPDLLHPSQVLGPMNAIEASTPILEKTSPQRVGPRGFKRHTTARRSW